MWTIALITLSFIFFFLFTRTTKHHPPLPPGPPGLPVIGNLLSLHPDLHSYFATLARSYGPLFSLRLGTKLAVVVSSPAHAAAVLRENDAVFANRDVPAAALAATYGGSDIVWTSHGPELRFLRKICVREMLGAATLAALYNLRRREVRRTVNRIAGRCGGPVRVGEEMFLVTMNIVTEMLWGGMGEAVERESIGEEFRTTVAQLTTLLGTPNLSDFFPAVGWLDLQGVVRKMNRVAKKFDDIFERVIEKRVKTMNEDGKKGRDFLEVLLKMKDEFESNGNGGGENGVTFSMIHVKALLMDMVIGGTDTTSNTVEFAMAELMNKPEILKKVQEELDTVIGKNTIVEESHIYELPYLQAVMKEALRLHPAVPLLVPHCPSEPCIVGGYTIPKGSRVFFNVWAIHRDPSIWVNPLEFNPERFLNAKFDFNGNDFAFFPFGSGRRICAGIALAEKMVLFSLASLLHSFDWKWPEGEERRVEEKFGIVLSKKTPLVLIPEPRLSDPALYE